MADFSKMFCLATITDDGYYYIDESKRIYFQDLNEIKDPHLPDVPWYMLSVTPVQAVLSMGHMDEMARDIRRYWHKAKWTLKSEPFFHGVYEKRPVKIYTSELEEPAEFVMCGYTECFGKFSSFRFKVDKDN